MIKNIKLYANYGIKVEMITLVKNKFSAGGFIINDDDYDLAVALGGDGSFLRMVHANNFDSNLYYVGINLGTLGFAQEVNIDEIDNFILELYENKYKTEEIDIQETRVSYDLGIDEFYSLNEIVVRDRNLGAVKLDININNQLLERFVGDGILLTNSFGSTAQNLSHGGAIVYPGISSLQITPIGGINSNAYRTLINSVIVPSKNEIELVPYTDRNSMIVTTDANNYFYDKVCDVKSTIGNKKIRYLRMSRYDFTRKIQEKMLKL